MIAKNELIRIMETRREMALATSANNQSNVRIVNFYFDFSVRYLFYAMTNSLM